MADINLPTSQDIQTGLPHQAAQVGINEWLRIVASLDWDSLFFQSL